MKRIYLIVVAAAAIAAAGQGFRRRGWVGTASVHDPSVFRDRDGKYVIVGTHLASAASDNLISWRQTDMLRRAIAPEELQKIRSWNKDGNRGDGIGYMWAPDIIWNRRMRKYCLYLSANGDDWKSNIVMLTADKVDGPYTYAGSVVYGGFSPADWMETDVGKVLGVKELPPRYAIDGVANRRWGPRFPNCIDPCVFYDSHGKLWMTYGSWSGGIFMLALDPRTGLRDTRAKYPESPHSDPYFGKKIAGGAYVSGEGSYIEKIGEWYWLFMSYGELKAKGGYNIRVFRSKRPDGPYFDRLGNTPFYDRYRQNYNDHAGVRLFGAYKWKDSDPGMVAQGHNSAIVDDDGRAYIVYHTRNDTGHEGHYIRVHQLFLTKDRWLVASPYKTRGEKLDRRGLKRSEFPGEWEMILHILEIDYARGGGARPEKITLHADGSITGSRTGRWAVERNSPYITVTLDGVDTFKGVAYISAIDGTDDKTPVFTALGDRTQLTLWGSKSK